MEVSACGEGGEGAYARVYGDGVAWVGVGRRGGGGVKNKFGLKCFLDDYKCYMHNSIFGITC